MANESAEKGTFPVVVVDQFSPYTPYAVEKLRLKVEDFLPGGTEYARYTAQPYRPKAPLVLHVSDEFRPDWATTVLRPGADGALEVWKTRWDSSG